MEGGRRTMRKHAGTAGDQADMQGKPGLQDQQHLLRSIAVLDLALRRGEGEGKREGDTKEGRRIRATRPCIRMQEGIRQTGRQCQNCRMSSTLSGV